MDDENILDVRRAAGSLGIETAVLEALIEVESGGRTFVTVDGSIRPLVRYEHHVAWRAAETDVRARLVGAGLAVSGWDKSLAPKSLEAAWRLYEKARAIDPEVAAKATSWGVGQVMGFHAERLGFPSAAAMAGFVITGGFEAQLYVLRTFVELDPALVTALRARDWEEVARRYNGAGHAKNQYAPKLEAAYRRFTGGMRSPVVLRRGSEGPAVRTLQRALRDCGLLIGAVDGVFGVRTEESVKAFQRKHDLAVDGIVGAVTWAVVEGTVAEAVPPSQPTPATVTAEGAKPVGNTMASAIVGALGPLIAMWDQIKPIAEEAGIPLSAVVAGLVVMALGSYAVPRLVKLWDTV